GNHEVMMRGTFANVRLRNRLAPGTEGGFTVHLPDGEQMPIFDASVRYAADGVPLVVLAGKEYGSGSSRDWAAKGSQLLGIRAVLVESFERIHRSNLVGMGVLPLEFLDGASVAALGLTGREVFRIDGLEALADDGPLRRVRLCHCFRPRSGVGQGRWLITWITKSGSTSMIPRTAIGLRKSAVCSTSSPARRSRRAPSRTFPRRRAT